MKGAKLLDHAQSSMRNYVAVLWLWDKVSESGEENYPVLNIMKTNMLSVCISMYVCRVFCEGGVVWLIILALVEQIEKCAHISVK